MLYELVRPFLFALDAETAHELTLAGLRTANALHLPVACTAPGARPVRVMGLDFPNRVGLAAGLDKNGECIDGLAALGFGHLEIGTVTPRPQPGNPRPRLFRLPERKAIINRMGFNNHGVDALVANVRRAAWKGILGINIGKNFDTPIERAADDYLACLGKVYAFASYVTINISSPNTKNLRQLQEQSELDALLAPLKQAQESLAQQHGRYVPLALKIAPDLDEAQMRAIAAAVRRHRIDAVIATNTTVSREGVEHLACGGEAGGLSGAPLFEKSTAVLTALAHSLAGEVPVIGVGGILDGRSARAKLEAGAQLVQVYTGLIYRGPALVKEVIAATSDFK
ncbi:MAG: dihydroorotate dehydrogenase (quinone) [Rhodocyclaceae bacterium]|jgi:dihydroorotate dehydrogenase|nr:dihydroorotate dehydrogenase (quinone) [Rhodocyclaceae bacterium]